MDIQRLLIKETTKMQFKLTTTDTGYKVGWGNDDL